MNCPICKSKGKQITTTTLEDFKNFYLRCEECNCIFSSSQATDVELVQYYANYYTHGNLEIPEVAVSSLKKTVSSFTTFRSDLNTICDIGYGAGALLMAAESEGWKCAGSEFAEDSIRLGESRGWDVHKGDLTLNDLPGPYDVVTIIETLEHVSDPKELIRKSMIRLRSGGLVYGTTPNAQSLNAYVLKEKWSVLSFPEHPILLSQKALRKMLEELGFTEIRIKSRGLNPFDLTSYLFSKSHLRNKTFNPGNSRVEFGYALNSKMSGNFLGRTIKSLFNFVLRLTRTGDSLVFSAIK